MKTKVDCKMIEMNEEEAVEVEKRKRERMRMRMRKVI